MKQTSIWILGMLLILTAASSCISGNSNDYNTDDESFLSALFSEENEYEGKSDAATRQLDDFDRISVAEGINAELKKGNTTEVSLELENIVEEKIITEVKNGKLRLYIDGRNPRGAKIKAYVTFKNLQEIEGSSGAYVKLLSDVNSNEFDLESSSGASINIESTIEANSMDVNVNSGARLEADVLESDKIDLKINSGAQATIEDGTATNFTVSASSAGNVDAYGLEAVNVRASTSSGGGAKVNAKKSLTGRASSGGWVYYIGEPETKDISKSSGGSFKKKSI